MIDEIIKDAETRMGKSIDALQSELAKIRTGRAHPSILDQVKVDYYGTETPLSQVANINIEDSRTLTVTPWEKPMVAAIEKAIMNSDLGLNPMSAGTVIRIPLPPLTEERRRDLVKIVKHEAENSRIAIRNIRRDANGDFKDLLKEKEISEDESHQSEDSVQKITDKYVAKVDEMLVAKEAELMEV
jgi:ribosome recycling factor